MANDKGDNHYYIISTTLFVFASIVSLSMSAPSGADETTKNRYVNHTILDLTLEHPKDSDFVKVSWDVGFDHSSNSSNYFTGFVVSYYLLETREDEKFHEESESIDEGSVFQSAQLTPNTRSILLHLPELHDVRICVNASSFNQIQQDEVTVCSDWSISQWDDESDEIELNKLLAGTVAGCLFLIPCAVILVFIMKKDKQMKMFELMEELEEKQKLNHGFDANDNLAKSTLESGKLDGNKGDSQKGGLHEMDDRKTDVVNRQSKESHGPKIYVHMAGEGELGGHVYIERL